MNCKKVNSMLSEYIDGSLSEKQKSVVEEHISKCPNCIAELKYMQNMIYGLKNCSTERIPLDLWPQVRTTILDKTPHRIGIGKRWSYKYALSAFAVLIILAVILTNTFNLPLFSNRINNSIAGNFIESKNQTPQAEFDQFLNYHISAHKKQPLIDPDLMFITIELEKNGAVSNNR
ncbi:MAG: zf-HC2 domain-containing protein [Armatimonadota bacterium]